MGGGIGTKQKSESKTLSNTTTSTTVGDIGLTGANAVDLASILTNTALALNQQDLQFVANVSNNLASIQQPNIVSQQSSQSPPQLETSGADTTTGVNTNKNLLPILIAAGVIFIVLISNE